MDALEDEAIRIPLQAEHAFEAIKIRAFAGHQVGEPLVHFVRTKFTLNLDAHGLDALVVDVVMLGVVMSGATANAGHYYYDRYYSSYKVGSDTPAS